MRSTVVLIAAAGMLFAGLVLAQDRPAAPADDIPQPLPIEAETPRDRTRSNTFSPSPPADSHGLAITDLDAPTVTPRTGDVFDDAPNPAEALPAPTPQPLNFPDFPSNSARRRTQPTYSDPFPDLSSPDQGQPGVSKSVPNQAAQRVKSLTRRLGQVPRDSRASVAAELEIALNRLFDSRTQMRESQIANLERRIETLRTQLRERVSKKQDIVQLRLQTLINEANGLAF